MSNFNLPHALPPLLVSSSARAAAVATASLVPAPVLLALLKVARELVDEVTPICVALNRAYIVRCRGLTAVTNISVAVANLQALYALPDGDCWHGVRALRTHIMCELLADGHSSITDWFRARVTHHALYVERPISSFWHYETLIRLAWIDRMIDNLENGHGLDRT